ncbi:MAG: DUF4167 domain-containing protein [Alphaproteobacteria bacterium]|nr:DUF4167 domain-containing protein [Alphaproteobacteria bacterium]
MYNLNYRFDSVSPAGKFSGTALDLIKRYNELAKEASSAGNYVEMEVFRQYAEHYRKIVTEINERKNTNQPQLQTKSQEAVDDASEQTNSAPIEEEKPEQSTEVITQKPLSLKKKTLTVIEVKENDQVEQSKEEKPKRIYKKKAPKTEDSAAAV